MSIIDFAIKNLSTEDKELIKNRNLADLADHMGISMLIRNLIFEYYKNEATKNLNLNLEFSTIDFFWKGEVDENYVLEELWRVLNKIEFNEHNRQALRKIVGDEDPFLINEKVKVKMFEYINGLKK